MVFLAVAASGVSQSLFVRSQELMMKKSLGVFLHFFFIAVRIQCEVALQLDNRMRLIMLLSICGVRYIFFYFN